VSSSIAICLSYFRTPGSYQAVIAFFPSRLGGRGAADLEATNRRQYEDLALTRAHERQRKIRWRGSEESRKKCDVPVWCSERLSASARGRSPMRKPRTTEARPRACRSSVLTFCYRPSTRRSTSSLRSTVIHRKLTSERPRWMGLKVPPHPRALRRPWLYGPRARSKT
jgi:hypothetical protein